MRSDIVTGAVFPDYELSDHTGKRRRLSELQGQDPMILVLSRVQWEKARDLGSDRVELYTRPYAEAFILTDFDCKRLIHIVPLRSAVRARPGYRAPGGTSKASEGKSFVSSREQ